MVIDNSAVIAILLDEPESASFAETIAGAEAVTAAPTFLE